MAAKDRTFIKYHHGDKKYAGAEHVIDEELAHLKDRRQSDPNNLKGIALSGGGIRSASFCLGVTQALAKNNKLKVFDYLSTVSGGGYLGGALSWLWLGKWRGADKCKEKFGSDSNNFPFGTDGRHSNPDQDMDKDQASLLRHLRQHGKYLVPGKGITSLSFISVILRSLAMGLVTILVLTSFVFHLLNYTPIYDKGFFFETFALDFSMYAGLAYLLCLLFYGLFAISYKSNSTRSYFWRRRWEKWIANVLKLVLAIATVAVAETLRVKLAADVKNAGGMSALIGAIFVWYSQKPKKLSLLKALPMPLLVNVGVTALFIGIIVLANHFSYLIINYQHGAVDFKSEIFGVTYGFIFHAVISAILVLLAYLIPINKVSIHRYYRDRLMETFTPDICDVLNQKDITIATEANKLNLHDCLSPEGNDMPYHIINSNIVLVESKIPKFRGRGGDNFIMSPLYSGSNATGWHSSETFANGSITLPTAVAISGAAANSDSGVAGKGLTINPLVSVLMTVFNLRLGYWAVNPDTNIQPNQAANPNYLIPGFRGMFSRKKLNETAKFVQLSDGGHFENLAMYELLRRRCKLIICCDAEEDKNFLFESLSNIVEKARVDFGVKINICADDLEKLRYKQKDDGSFDFADSAYIVSDITYPSNTSGLDEENIGKLIYIKTTLPKGLPADVMGYKSLHPAFPDESTMDQFFNEKQMEAYRMLGMHIGETLMSDDSITW